MPPAMIAAITVSSTGRRCDRQAPRGLRPPMRARNPVATACGSKTTTLAEALSAADRAHSAGQSAEAVKLYAQILAWQGAGTLSEAERFKSSLEAVKCLLQLDRTNDAVVRYEAMFTTFAEMKGPKAYLNTIAVLDTLDRAKVDEQAFSAALLKLANIADTQHPDVRDKFRERVTNMMNKVSADDDNLAELRKLPYLG